MLTQSKHLDMSDAETIQRKDGNKANRWVRTDWIKQQFLILLDVNVTTKGGLFLSQFCV